MSLESHPLSLPEILRISLQAGLLLHQSGAGTHRTSLLLQQTARKLGAEEVEVMISSTNIGATVMRNGVHETGFRKAPHMGANFAIYTAVNQWCVALENGTLPVAEAQDRLARIALLPVHYPRWLVAVLVGVSCGGFAALFGGDLFAILITSIGAMVGMGVRNLLLVRHFRPFVFATCGSFAALLVTGLLKNLSHTPDAALAASVLFLIPGVPLINGASDLLNANYLNGIVRFTMSAVIVFGIAVGVSLALRIIGS